MNKSIAVFLLIAVLLFVQFSFCQTDLKSYTARLVTTFGQEIETIKQLHEFLNAADLETNSGIAAFSASLEEYHKVLNGYYSFYRDTLPSDAPTEVRDSVRFAMLGTLDITDGLNTIATALTQKDTAEFRRAHTLFGSGTTHIDEAVDKYNSWVEAHNTRVESERKGWSLGASFSRTMRYGKPLLIVYGYMLIAGLILSTGFKAQLASLVAGRIKADRFRSTALYGLHLILLFPLLYALLAFSLLLIWDFILVSLYVVSEMGRIPIVLIIAIVMVVLGSIGAVIQGFFGSKQRHIVGVSIKRQEQPQIWELCDHVAHEVGTKPVQEIVLSPQPGIGVHLSGTALHLIIGRTQRTLTIGLPSIAGLSIEQMKAILAHEFGHFSNKDTAWNSLTFTMAAALGNTLSTMPSPWNSSGWVAITSAINPALWVMVAYRFLFSIVTNGFSRLREVFADRTAVALYGYESFTKGLMRVVRNDSAFASDYVPNILDALQHNQRYENIYNTMEEDYRSVNDETVAQTVETILKSEKASVFDSHPLTKERLIYAKHFDRISHRLSEDQAEIKTLFSHWDEVTQNLSDLFTYSIAVATGNEKLVNPNICKACGAEYREGFLLPNGLCPQCDKLVKEDQDQAEMSNTAK